MGAKTAVLLFWLQVFGVFVFADVWKLEVEHEIKALVSSCVVLPCSFKYPGKILPSLLREKASQPELHSDQSLQEGHPAVFRCSVRHTCPSYQPALTWNHNGKEMVTYKDIGHGNWEVESFLTFTPTKEDDHTNVTCTVSYHGVKDKLVASRPIFVKEQATINHILIPAVYILGAALLVGGLCFFIVKRYKRRIEDLQSRTDNRVLGRLSRMSRR